jgi:hypothetical protein
MTVLEMMENDVNSVVGLTEWLEQNQPEPVVVRRSTHPFARAQQFMPDWTNWVDKDGACFWHE